MARPENSHSSLMREMLLSTDSRLPVANEVTRTFIQGTRFDYLQLREIPGMVEGLQVGVARALESRHLILEPTPIAVPRRVNIENIQSLQEILYVPGGVYLAERHGGQVNLDEEIRALKGAAQKKALLRETPQAVGKLTDVSIVETAGLAFILAFVREKTGKQIVVETAPHPRAAEAALKVAEVLEAPFIVNYGLACVKFPDGMSDEAIDEVLGLDNNGAPPMERDIIDRLEGKGAYDRRVATLMELRNRALARGNVVTIAFQHSQELEELQRRIGFDPVRLGELGLVAENATGAYRLENGPFSAAA